MPKRPRGVHDKEGIICCQIDADDKRYLAESLRTDFLPSCPALLMDEDPIPLYALKLLAGSINNGGARRRKRTPSGAATKVWRRRSRILPRSSSLFSVSITRITTRTTPVCVYSCAAPKAQFYRPEALHRAERVRKSRWMFWSVREKIA